MLVALVLLILGLAISLLNRGPFNPGAITLFMLAVSSGLAALRLYDLYDFDQIGMKIVLVGGVSVFLGALLARISRRTPQLVTEPSDKQEDLIRYPRLNLALVLSSASIIATRWPQLEILGAGGSLGDVRNSFLGYGGNDAAMDLIDRLFVGPVLIVSLPLFIWGILRKQTDPLFVTCFLTALVLNQVTSGGRFVFLFAGVMTLALLAKAGVLHLRTATARLTLILLFGATVAFTLARGNTLAFEAYTYFAIPVPLLAHWANSVEAAAIYTHGGGFVYGGLTLIFRLSEFLGIPLGSDISAAVALPQNYWVELVPGRPFNAFVTMFYYFYLDYRWVGVCAGGFAWGALGQWCFGRMWNSGLRATIVGLLMLQVATMSFVRWEFTNGSLVIGLLMIPFFVRSSSAHTRSLESSPRTPECAVKEGGSSS